MGTTYERFAKIYDEFIGADYDMWVEYIHKIWQRYGHTPRLVAELGCGTGNITTRLAKEGIDIIGIDYSEEMLAEAVKKSEYYKIDVLYLMQDMREFELFGTVDCIISLCDSINYITEHYELLQVFKLVNNYLDPGGLFIFDLNTEYKFKNILSDNTFADTDDDSAYIWNNFYDEESGINEYDITFFVKSQNENKYERFEEYHYEKSYKLDEISKIIEESGMKLLDVFDAYTFDSPKPESERVFIVAQEIIKEGQQQK